MLATCKEHTSSLKEALRENQLKATPARLSILDILTHSSKPLSVKDMQTKIKDVVDTATLYRTFDTLKSKGLVTTIDLKHGHAHYEIVTNKHHHHLICEGCGKVVDISKCDVSGIEKQALRIGNFSRVNNHSLELFGLCNNCAK